MFSKLFVLSAILAVATAAPNSAPSGTGTLECCESVKKASDPAATKIIDALDIVIQDLDVLVGLTCSAISVIGVGTGDAWYALLLAYCARWGLRVCIATRARCAARTTRTVRSC